MTKNFDAYYFCLNQLLYLIPLYINENAQNESTHQQGLALPNHTVETSAH